MKRSGKYGKVVPVSWTAFAALALPFAFWAQDLPVFRADATLVTVPCTVTDANGTLVTGLTAEDFRLYDNGIRQEIRHFWKQSELPLVLGIVVDVSDSQQRLLREHRRAAELFVENIVRPGDRAFVVEVSENARLRSVVTGSPHGLAQVLLPARGAALGEPCPVFHQRSLCGGTALWNALFALVHLKLAPARGIKALVILSDGNDTGSVPHGLTDALEAAQREGVVVFAIRYPDPLANQDGGGLLQLTRETGGALFDPPGTDYAPVLAAIGANLRSQYVVGFHPQTGVAGKRHELRLEVTRSGLTVRSRQEYFEPRD